jgi:hypothetical protein
MRPLDGWQDSRRRKPRSARIASGRQLWRLNRLRLLREALSRAEPITSAIAHELLARAKDEGDW